MKKKIISLLACVILLVSSVPFECFAATGTASASDSTGTITKEDPVVSTTEPTDDKLEGAILAVKKVITIPQEYTEFNYNYNSAGSYSNAYWSLTWSNPKTYACIQVNCDTDNHIIYYYKYDSSAKSTGIAKYLKSELKSKAEDFIKIIAPEISDELDYIDANYDGVYSGNYIYYYQRKNNGVDFPDNAVSISMSSVTGEVMNVSIHWLYNVKVPSASTKITKAEAAELIKKNMKMKLVYRTNYYNIYNDGITTTKKAFLVYVPEKDYISVDAKTGEVYLTRAEIVDTANTAKMEDSATGYSSKNYGSSALTDAEIAKIEELKKLISKSEAIKKITDNKYLYLDSNLSSYTASLQKWENGSGDSSYVWSINLSDPREVNYETDKDTYRAYVYATVDAKSGKILSFYTNMKGNYDEVNQKWNTVKIAYDKEQGKKILEKFLKAQVADRFNNSVLTEQDNDYIAYYSKKDPVYGGYSYQYTRVNEGVEYSYNNIYGSVDGVTGKIYSYGSNWDYNITFESPKGVISAEAAMNYYLGNNGFDLKYEINTLNKINSSNESKDKYQILTEANTVEYEIRLVYRPDVVPAYISPFTGKQLNEGGEEYTEAKPYSYKDIDNSEQYKNVRLLADMNIGFQGDNFLPNQLITVNETYSLLANIGYYSTESDTEKSDSPITKEKLAQLFIHKLGLDKLAKLQGIYDTGYVDKSNIDNQYLGAVALAKGLGLMKADANNYFNPKSNITRLEAVNLIMNFVEAQQNGIY